MARMSEGERIIVTVGLIVVGLWAYHRYHGTGKTG